MLPVAGGFGDAPLAPAPSTLLELRIPTSLENLQGSKYGPLSTFLDKIQSELAKAGHLNIERLQLLSIRGEYTRVPRNSSATSVLAKSSGNGGMSTQTMAATDQHVIV